ncbi:MAG: phosphoglucosamine mutase, partial [Acidimicrobiia bacterium]
VAVDENGVPANGDVVMAILARHWKDADRLRGDLVVVTVMSNLGFRKAMAEAGIELVETKVGDRYVREAMIERGAVLGGEQSGHIIFLNKAQTGDGLLTALLLLEVVAGTGKPLRLLREEAIVEYPQVLRSVRVPREADLEAADLVWEALREVDRALGEEGRVLVRASGTEPVVRVMVEALDRDTALRYADHLSTIVRNELGEG